MSNVYLGLDVWNSPYLGHYGVKGMKWGVRKDRTRLGARKGKINKEQVSSYARKAFTPGPKAKPSPAEKIANSSRNAVDPVKNIVRATNTKNRPDVSKMSDEELRKRINRLEMERRYETLVNSDLSPGRRKAMNILDVVGGVLAISASAATIATAIYQIKK